MYIYITPVATIIGIMLAVYCGPNTGSDFVHDLNIAWININKTNKNESKL